MYIAYSPAYAWLLPGSFTRHACRFAITNETHQSRMCAMRKACEVLPFNPCRFPQLQTHYSATQLSQWQISLVILNVISYPALSIFYHLYTFYGWWLCATHHAVHPSNLRRWNVASSHTHYLHARSEKSYTTAEENVYLLDRSIDWETFCDAAWLRMGWQSRINKRKIVWNTPPRPGIEPGPQRQQTVRSFILLRNCHDH